MSQAPDEGCDRPDSAGCLRDHDARAAIRLDGVWNETLAMMGLKATGYEASGGGDVDFVSGWHAARPPVHVGVRDGELVLSMTWMHAAVAEDTAQAREQALAGVRQEREPELFAALDAFERSTGWHRVGVAQWQLAAVAEDR